MQSSSARAKTFLSRFAGNRKGVVAVIFALSLAVVVVSAGIGIDMARGVSASSRLQSAVDSAVLAAARNALGSQSELEAAANSVFDANKPSNITVVTNGLTVSGNQVTYAATATLPTTLAAVTGTKKFDLSVTASAFRKTDKTEIVIALDTTASMGFGSSWQDAKAAMASMLVELDGLSQTQSEFYATFFPFSDRVNVGQARAESWLSVTSPPNGHWGNKPNGPNTNRWCLEPRDELIAGNPNALTDKSPSMLGFLPSAKDYWVSSLAKKSYFTCPSQEVMGPTANISSFQSTIEGLPLGGTGRFDMGLAWAYRMLSPNWQGEWGVTGYPAAYGARRKIAIFITDAHTEAYTYEVPNQTGSSTNARPWGHNNGSVEGFTNMVEVCSRMKTAGIEVHTIYVNGNSNGIPYMKQCATNEQAYYHNVSDISELNTALSKIASSVVQVGLTD